jgi:hypothetical protein
MTRAAFFKGIGSVMSLFPRFSVQANAEPLRFDRRAEMVADRMGRCFADATLGSPDIRGAERAASAFQRQFTAPSGSPEGDLNPGYLSREALPTRRSFLFLQGMATRFFKRLGHALADRGHAVHRVNFNGGDRAFWRLPGAVDFCGHPAEWPEFLDRLIVERAISDIILFGDDRPLHRAAIHVAESRARRVHVVDEGYLRPDWITFEEAGSMVVQRCRGIRAGTTNGHARFRLGATLRQCQAAFAAGRSRTCSIRRRRLSECGGFRTMRCTVPIIS